MRHLTDWSDLPAAVWDACLARAAEHRADRRWTQAAAGKALGLVFFNPSLRTRVSMEMAAAHLGAASTVLTPGAGTWNLAFGDGPMTGAEAEHVREAIGVLGRYVDALGVRTFASLTDAAADRADAAFRAVVAASSVPVVNLESARWHPCQALADAATIRETFGADVRGRRFVLAWAPHPKALPHAVPHSALLAAARLGMDVVVARPDACALDADVVDLAREAAARAGGTVSETDQRADAFENAHVVYAKAWAGRDVYDDPASEAARRAEGSAWTVREADFAATADARLMHCLPVRRGVVVDGDVLDGPRAVHLLEAEYRLHAQKAVLEWVWEVGGFAAAGPAGSGEQPAAV